MFFFFILGPTWRLDTNEFKEHCREMISEITQRDGVVIINDDEKPVAKMTRYMEIPNPARGAFKDTKILGDIEGPMPVEWYTDPAVQTDEDWKIDGPMPASWFVDSHEGHTPEYRMPEKVDVSVLHRHKVLTLNTSEFTAQLVEVISAVVGSGDGKVIVFDDNKPLVELTAARKGRFDAA